MEENRQVHEMNTGNADREVDKSREGGLLFDSTFNWFLSEMEVAGADRLTARVAITIQDVEKLRPVWDVWTYSLDTDFDYYLHTLKNDSTVLRPYVVTVHKDGIAQALLLGQVKKRRVSADVSFVHIPGPTVRVLEITNGGTLGCQSAAIDKLMASVLIETIKNDEVDLICFQCLSLHSELFNAIRELSGVPFNARVSEIRHYTVLYLPAPAGNPPSTFVGKAKHEVRRKARILQSAFPGKVRFQCFSPLGALDLGIRDAMSVLSSTWQYSLGFSLLNKPQTHENMKFFARQGWLRVFVLYVDDFPCAFLIGQLYANTFYCQDAGCHRKFLRFSVGSLLTAWAFEELAAAGVRQVNLGDGDQEYNRRIGCQMCEEGSVHVYSRTLLGICVNGFFALTEIVRAGGRRILPKSRRKWLVRGWRQLARCWYASNDC